jgi:hypothetical protein
MTPVTTIHLFTGAHPNMSHPKSHKLNTYSGSHLHKPYHSVRCNIPITSPSPLTQPIIPLLGPAHHIVVDPACRIAVELAPGGFPHPLPIARALGPALRILNVNRM